MCAPILPPFSLFVIKVVNDKPVFRSSLGWRVRPPLFPCRSGRVRRTLVRNGFYSPRGRKNQLWLSEREELLPTAPFPLRFRVRFPIAEDRRKRALDGERENREKENSIFKKCVPCRLAPQEEGVVSAPPSSAKSLLRFSTDLCPLPRYSKGLARYLFVSSPRRCDFFFFPVKNARYSGYSVMDPSRANRLKPLYHWWRRFSYSPHCEKVLARFAKSVSSPLSFSLPAREYRLIGPGETDSTPGDHFSLGEFKLPLARTK